MRLHARNYIVAFSIFLWGSTSAQLTTVSPYSYYGLGNATGGAFAQQVGMGNLSSALHDVNYLNSRQPASYAALRYTTFEVGLTDKLVTQTSGNTVINNNTMSVDYFSIGIPLGKNWGMGVGLQPFSFIGYEIFESGNDANFGDLYYRYRGRGGLNQAVFGTGYQFKNLSVGANAHYLFGSTDRSSDVLFADSRFLHSKFLNRVSVNDFIFSYGAQWIQPMSNGKELIVGFTHNLGGAVKAEQTVVKYSYSLNASGVEVPRDTAYSSINEGGTVTIPQNLDFGLTYGRRDEETGRMAWMFGADYRIYSNSQYKAYDGYQPYADGSRISIGGSIIPELAFPKKRYTNYFSRVEYRIGAFTEDDGLRIKNTSLPNNGVSLGFGLPVGGRSQIPGDIKFATLHFGMVLGSRGKSDNGLIKESYTNFTFGITLNDKWFTKFKYR